MIKEILESITPEQTNLLMFAFEEGETQFITLPQHHFLGVNVSHIKHFKILEEAGDWAYGTIQGSKT